MKKPIIFYKRSIMFIFSKCDYYMNCKAITIHKTEYFIFASTQFCMNFRYETFC